MRKVDRIAGFDGVRAIAFLCVFANHKLDVAQDDALGSVGVWTFFVLSGFLITGILARSREAMESQGLPGPTALGRFYLRRSARIFPIYYVVLATALALSAFVSFDHFGRAEKLSFALYATNILVGFRGEWVGDFGHLWSLAVEEQFYLLFAPLVLFIPRRRTALLCSVFMTVGAITKIGLELAETNATSIYVNSVVNFGILGFGGLVGLAAARARPPAWLTCGAAQLLTGTCLLAAPLAFGARLGPWLSYGTPVVLLAGLLLFQVANGQNTRVVALLESAPPRLIGRISYAAYLVHPFIHYATFQRLLDAAGVDWHAPRAIQIVAEFAATIAISTVSWVILERPILNWAARMTGRTSIQTAPSGGFAGAGAWLPAPGTEVRPPQP